MNCCGLFCLEPELEEGEVKYCPDCGMVLDPFLTYCPACGTLVKVRQAQTESPVLMLTRCAVVLADGFSFVSIFVNLIEGMIVFDWLITPHIVICTEKPTLRSWLASSF